ncbi:MAG: DUF6364 family protein [Bacteroidota bacterium]
MQVKLTLRMDAELIRKMKRYSKRNGKSISQMVADFFDLVNNEPGDEQEISPRVRSLYGVLAGKDVAEQDYHTYLEEKHQ